MQSAQLIAMFRLTFYLVKEKVKRLFDGSARLQQPPRLFFSFKSVTIKKEQILVKEWYICCTASSTCGSCSSSLWSLEDVSPL